MAYSITAVKESEREQIHRFYEELCRCLEGEDYGPGWHYGIYPADEDLDARIRAGEMFCARAEERLAAAMVIVGRDDPIYRDVAWEIREEPIHVLHLLAVHPDFRGSGLAQAMLSFLLERARRMGAKAGCDPGGALRVPACQFLNSAGAIAFSSPRRYANDILSGKTRAFP